MKASILQQTFFLSSLSVVLATNLKNTHRHRISFFLKRHSHFPKQLLLLVTIFCGGLRWLTQSQLLIAVGLTQGSLYLPMDAN